MHKLKHTDERPFKCGLCNYAGKSSLVLNEHMRIHTGEKPYECDICGYRAASGGSICAHKRRHQGIKPHKCLLCDKNFLKKSDLKMHQLKAHSSVRSYKCDHCEYSGKTLWLKGM